MYAIRSYYERILNEITNQYIAADSTKATNSTISVISFHFISGFLSIAVIAHHTNIHSHTHAHNQANHIANHVHSDHINVIDSLAIN